MLSLSKSIRYISRQWFRSVSILGRNMSSYDSLKTNIKSEIPKKSKDGKTELVRQLQNLIEARGPIPVADYMKMALMHPKYGFYQQNNVIGKEEAHFITSPEISPVFGELLGIWCYAQWEKLGKPKNIQLIELGPGKGTLMSDLLRAAKHFPGFYRSIQLHMIEQSAEMIKKQQYALNCVYPSGSKPAPNNKDKKMHMRINGPNSIDVYWHSTIDEVPEQYPTILVANEFLDALPIYKFQLSDKGWREVQIACNEDLDENGIPKNNGNESSTPVYFKEVLNPNLSPITVAMLGGKLEGKNEEESSKALDEWMKKRKELITDMANQLDNTLNSVRIDGKNGKTILKPDHKLILPNGVKVPRDTIENSLFKENSPLSNSSIFKDSLDSIQLNSSESKPKSNYVDIIKQPEQNLNSSVNVSENIKDSSKIRTEKLNSNEERKPLSMDTLSDAKLGDMIETCPDANMIIQNYAYRISRVGGVGLFIDYGHNHASSNSLRGIRSHQFVNYLETPGEIDITADVDFYTLKKTVENSDFDKKIECFGPIPQGYFLCGLGIEARVNQILETLTDEEEIQNTMKAAERLVLKENMGEIFKCFAVSSIGLPLGFEGGEQFL